MIKTPTKTEEQYARERQRYENKWVALVRYEVVASGATLQEVQEKVSQKRVKKYVFHLVPPSSASFIPFLSYRSWRPGACDRLASGRK